MEIFLLWIFLSIAVGALGASRNIGFGGAFILSLLLSPLVGIIFTVASNKKEHAVEISGEAQSRIDTLANSGKTKYSNKDYQGAILDFEEILTITPNSAPNSNYRLAQLYSLTNNKEKSFKHLSKAVEQGYKNYDNINNSPDLEFLRKQPEFKEFVMNGYKWIEKSTISETPLDKIEKLGKLRQQGLITEEEYQEKKKKLLESI